jgi:hypothetical protein
MPSTQLSPPDPPGDAASASEAQVHPLIRNALRVSLSAKEYKVLHERILKRSQALEHRLPTPSTYETIVRTSTNNKYNVAAIRASLRVFVALGGGLEVFELAMARIKKDGFVPSFSHVCIYIYIYI